MQKHLHMSNKIIKFHQGIYKPKNPEKYKGNKDQIFYRSGLERRFMLFLDNCPLIKQWSSETTVIPYINQVDGKHHRYFVDNWIKLANNKEYLIEIKPKKQCSPPRKNSKQYLAESLEFVKNQSKWQYADKYAKKNNMEFKVLTEKEINSIFSDTKILENVKKVLNY